MSFRSFLAVVVVLMANSITGGKITPLEARGKVEELIEEQTNINLLLEFQRRRKSDSSRYDWGAGQAGQLGNENAMNIVGGPAGPPQQ